MTPSPVAAPSMTVTRLDDDGNPTGDPLPLERGTVTITITPDLTGFVQGAARAWQRLAEGVQSLTVPFQRMGRDLARLLYGGPLPKPKTRRTPAASRTRSTRWRAGTRRTKRHARRRHQ